MLTLDFDKLGVRAGDKVLDIGCGFGRHSYEVVRRGGHAVACDLALPELQRVLGTFTAMSETEPLAPSARGSAVNASILSLPYADNSFDHVIASEVLEHIPDDTDAMAELARVTKPGGTIAVTVPRAGQEVVCWILSNEYHNTPGGHVRIYRQKQITDRLSGAGLRPYGFGFAHALHTPYWWLRCAVGPKNEANPLVKAYRSFLEWDIIKGPPLVRMTERMLNPVLGKSLIVYLSKPDVRVAEEAVAVS
ncbi:MAG: methyltransferase domain-containing protein [Actinomycetota bacterium]